MLRTSPSLAGTVKMSPRAPKTARAPLGERSPEEMKSETFCRRGMRAAKSPEISIVSLRVSPLATS